MAVAGVMMLRDRKDFISAPLPPSAAPASHGTADFRKPPDPATILDALTEAESPGQGATKVHRIACCSEGSETSMVPESHRRICQAIGIPVNVRDLRFRISNKTNIQLVSSITE